MAVVGTLSALVSGLLLSTASSSFATRNQEVVQISANLIPLERLLRRYGPAAETSPRCSSPVCRNEMQDLFPETGPPDLDNPRMINVFEELENGVLALKPGNNTQQWLQSQALRLANQAATTHWALAQQSPSSIPFLFLIALVFWLTIVFVSFGLSRRVILRQSQQCSFARLRCRRR